MVELSEPVEEWHSYQNRTLRCVPDIVKWVLAQVGGEYMANMYKIMSQPKDEKAPAKVDLILPNVQACQAQRQALEDFALEEQGGLARLMSDGALLLVGLRILRSVWLLLGWPSRLALCMCSDTHFAPSRGRMVFFVCLKTHTW